ncbi:hypothetical protein F4678DRAFT_469013 [Xylaria arbuscula]|nr:hypothetical protein F4678DRAFT_469013 [Xylaria arbuscula]
MAQVGLLLILGYFREFGWKCVLVTGGGTLVFYIYMLFTVDLANTFHFHIFGGQGWPGLFNIRSTLVAEHDSRSSPHAENLLKTCHAWLIKDASSLYRDGVEDTAGILSNFGQPDSLVRPPEHYQNNPALQGAFLCLFQLLRYIAEASTPGDFEKSFNQTYSTAGFCSGMLPAIVVASSPTIEEFVKNGVQAFRAAFWIGYVLSEYSRNLTESKDYENDPWAYNLTGIGNAETTSLLSRFNSEIRKPELKINVAAVIHESNMSISGHPATLREFLSRLPSHCIARPVCVNTLYHGGDALIPVVGTILEDFQFRDIKLPSFDDLRCPVFSSWDGSPLSRTMSCGYLPREIIDILLVKPVNWAKVLCSLEPICKERVTVTYGPSPHVLMPSTWLPTSASTNYQKRDASQESFDVQLRSNYSQKEQDVAIIGAGLDFPNGSNLEDFWDSLKRDLNTQASTMPQDRFPTRNYEKEDIHMAGTVFGSFIKDPWSFDNALFKISPREARSMDPQQRILLQISFHALQHAGYVPDATKCFQRETFGCYIGVATQDYAERIGRQEPDVYYNSGTLRAFLSGRISHHFGFSGPSIVIDTACSSSLVAIHQACRALIAGECNAALAGGVNIICGSATHKGLARAHFLSSTGQCRPFDVDADGYCRGEGGGIFVLKRLSDAIAEHDNILGVIKATAVNQSGNATSISHPDTKTQQALFQSILSKSNILAQSVTAVEAHGTGTQAGDPAEFESLSAVFGTERNPLNKLFVSSIKGNIGHAEAASGAAGLAKLLMMMHHGQVPRQVGLRSLNPRIAAFKTTSTIIPDTLIDWPLLAGLPRRALLNNFGAAGSNACLILEEHVPRVYGYESTDLTGSEENSAYLFVLSAKNTATLERYRTSILRRDDLRKASLRDLAYTSTRRMLHECRIATVCSSTEELFDSLEKEPISITETPCRQVLLVFSGQGSQYLGMGKELFFDAPRFRQDILHCNAVLADAGYPSFLPLINSDDSAEYVSLDHCNIIETHCAIFAVEYALTRLYQNWGVKVDAVMGHSLGEYAALVAASVLRFDEAILAIAQRARLITELCEKGSSSMLSIYSDSSHIQSLLNSCSTDFSSLTVACDNGPQQCVVSGPTKAVDELSEYLQTIEVKSKRIKVPFGYHSPIMDPILLPFSEYLSSIRLQEPTMPVSLCLHGRMYRPGDIESEYFAAQIVSPVRFREAAEDLLSGQLSRNTICLEVGPHPVVLPMMKALMQHPSTVLTSSLRNDTSSWTSICQSLAEFVRCGIDVNFRNLYDGQRVQLVELPLYPFSKDRFMIPHEPCNLKECERGHLTDGSNGTTLAAYNMAYDPVERFIQGHSVAGQPLCPASVYVELACQAAQAVGWEHATRNHVIEIKDVTFSSPLVCHDTSSKHGTPVQVIVSTPGELLEGNSFKISLKKGNHAEVTYCEGHLGLANRKVWVVGDIGRHVPNPMTTISEQTHQTRPQLLKKKLLYETIFSRVVSYSDFYQTMDYLELSDDARSAWGSFRLPRAAFLEGGISQPVFVDTLLHAAGFLANSASDNVDMMICVHIRSLRIKMKGIDYNEPFSIYTEIFPDKSGLVGNSFAYDGNGNLVGTAEGIAFRQLSENSFVKMLMKASGDNIFASNTNQDSHNGTIPKDLNGLHAHEIPPLKTERPRRSSSPSLSQTDHAFVANGTGDRVGNSAGSDVTNGYASEEATNNNTSYPQSAADEVISAVADAASLQKDEIGIDSSLQYIGVDSFMAFELLELLQARLRVQIPHRHLDSCKTPRDIVRLVEAEQERNQLKKDSSSATLFSTSTVTYSLPRERLETSAPHSKSLILIQRARKETQPSKAPIYLIHDGSGMCSMYNGITGLGRDIYGIASDPQIRFNSIEEMATSYARLIDTDHPFLLGGWSFGGVVSLEIARILHYQAQQLGAAAHCLGVVMIDSPCPTGHDGLPPSILLRVSKGKPDWVLSNFEAHTTLLSAHNPDPKVWMACANFPVALIRAEGSENPAASDSADGEFCPFLARNGAEWTQQVEAWRALVGSRLSVLETPGSHFELFNDEFAKKTSKAIYGAILLLDERRVTPVRYSMIGDMEQLGQQGGR